MANYPQERAQDAVCQSHTGHMTGLWFLPARPLRLNTNEWMNEWMNEQIKYQKRLLPLISESSIFLTATLNVKIKNTQ